MHPFEDPQSLGKLRPMILLGCRDGCQWKTMGLTTNPTYLDGRPRTPIPNPAELGLTGQGFLWGSRLTRISVLDLYAHIGWASKEVLELIDRLLTRGGDIQ